MNLKGILAIAGHPGLFKLVSQMKGGLVVESLTDGRRMPAYTTQRVLSLDEISIYTEAEEVRLSVVFDSIIDKEGGKPAIDPKNASIDELRAYLAEILPTYDRERVYASDIKKLFGWYNDLASKGLALKEETSAEETGKATPDDADSDAAKPAKKPTAKKEAAPKKSAPKASAPTSKGKVAATMTRKAGKA
ncbi:MAG: DUF5606 domain-containing protein [Flavobacteriales bacterium]|nr:DUF5606 domain-containing protein [Flavobacteriales bacterium]